MEEELFGSPLDDTTIEELLDGMDDDQTEGNDHMVDAFILAGADRSEAKAPEEATSPSLLHRSFQSKPMLYSTGLRRRRRRFNHLSAPSSSSSLR